MNLVDKDDLRFGFIVDFPLFDWNDGENRWDPSHHPFTGLPDDDVPLLDSDPGKVRARSYDLVCNGSEISSGSIRIHKRDLQEKVFSVLNYTSEEINDRFGHLLEAFEYGAPPHGGVAPGIDRIVMILAGVDNLREGIAFPKTQAATDQMMDAPSVVSESQLRELSLRVVKSDD